MLTRRDVLWLGALLSAASPVLVGCGSGGGGTRTLTDLGLVRSDTARTAGTPGAVGEVVTSMNRLAGGLYAKLPARGNLVISPYSIAVALGMTRAGAGGDTAAEMDRVLGVTDVARFHGGLNALTSHIEGLAGPRTRGDGTTAELILEAANQLYGQTGVGWQQRFLDLLATQYGAGLRTVDFRTAPEQARTVINDWVSARTHSLISELVPANVIDALTRLVLVNALYLKAPWDVPFETFLTTRRPFHRGDGTTVEVDTMTDPTASTAIGEGDGWRSARLLYAGRALAMTIVLPDPGRMSQVEQQITTKGLAPFLTHADQRAVHLELPSWTFRTQAPLSEQLQQLGMRLAFTGQADFTPMTDDDLRLEISEVVHEGYIAVDEAGTEAAAATAVVMRASSMPVNPPFHVDRPFLFAIHDVEHGTPLFVGRVDDPPA